MTKTRKSQVNIIMFPLSYREADRFIRNRSETVWRPLIDLRGKAGYTCPRCKRTKTLSHYYCLDFNTAQFSTLCKSCCSHIRRIKTG